MRLTKRIVAILALVGLILGTVTPAMDMGKAYAAVTKGKVSVESTGAQSATQGSKKNMMTFTIYNGEATNLTYSSATLTVSGKDLTVTGPTSGGTITTMKTDDINFRIDVKDNADVGTRTATLMLDGTDYGSFNFAISENLASPDKGGAYIASADISHSIVPSGGFTPGDGNKIEFEIFNNGTSIIKDAMATITLPDAMSVHNDSGSQSAGYLSIGTRKTVSFPISVSDTAETKNYAISLKITGRSQSNTDVSVERTFYIPVAGGNATSSTKNMAIQGISVPNAVTADQDFTMSFNVTNNGSAVAKNMKVFVEMPEGLLNKTTTTFVENSFAAGETKSYSVKMFSNTGGKTYPVKIAVDPLSGTGGNTLQYVSVYVEGGSGTAKTPQLMIDSYSYGGNSVKAGKDCSLNVGLYNTSGKTITNVKVSLASEDGTFVPFGSSNSFFVERIPAKGHYTKNVDLRVKPGAEQKTSAITVTMAYEDGAGGAYTATDIISIPVTQESRLVVDDVVPPYEVYVGQQGACEVSFYNMGKSVLSNLRANAEGNFDVMQSNSYYAGNMESGKSDSYSFTFVPREVGPMEGKLLFTYEDANGEPQNYEVAFTFQAMEMPVMEDPGMMQEEEKPKPWGLIIGGGIIVLLAVGATVFLKIRKRKLHKSLELADEAFMSDMDLGDEAEILEGTEEIKNSEAEETKDREGNGSETKASETGEKDKAGKNDK